MEYLQQRVESWIKDQRTKLLKVTWPQQWPIAIKWPWINGREHRKRMHEEYKRRKKQIHDLCIAVKADSLSDLQDILCCMVLSECVYKRPDAELIQAVNKFKADFGGQVVSLERIQPSSDHVPHRYLLAEAGDTLFASFIGTKQYKDVMADANILQGAIFHDDLEEDTDEILTNDLPQVDGKKKIADDIPKTLGAKPKQGVTPTKPAAHRGFMARAKGIPALELYRLAQKKKRKLVLCGHSLGGAVAVLATLAILRVIASASSSKEHERLNVKCITFSQPPVGNAALRNYVNEKGWQHYFKTYCIPEDLVPRILSPAYFHHYNSHTPPVPVNAENCSLSVTKKDARIERPMAKVKDNEGEQLVLGLGPVQNSFWRLSKLVPIEAVKRQFNKYRGIQFDFSVVSSSAAADSTGISSIEDTDDAPQSLEIQEDSDGISLKPLSTTDKGDPGERMTGNLSGKSKSSENHKTWRRVPTLPSYVPFGQLYLLGSSSVESLSGAEYSKLTSVKSVIAELRERLQSHSMRSYRSRFQRIYNTCMNDSSSSFLGMDQQQQFPQIQKWLGISLAGTIDLGHIVESPVICTATSLVPLGWNGVPGEKNVGPIKVDITGIGLHLCTLVQARVNGSWCSTTVETFPTAPTNYSDHAIQPDLQKIRVLVGNPLRRPPKHQIATDPSLSTFPSMDTESADQNRLQNLQAFKLGKFVPPDDGLSDFVVFCTTDFSTISKEVHVRTRRVRLVGLEGAGKTSLLNAILDQGRKNVSTNIENFPVETDVQEGIAGGLCFTDSAGVNLQDLNKEASRFRNELWVGVRDLCTKTDLIILVHNLSHKIPRYSHSNASAQPALSFLLDEAKALGIPWVLAITNKFSVSAHQQKPAVEAVIHAYQASPSTTAIINSCPYVMPTAKSALTSSGEKDRDSHVRMGPHKFLYAPINLVRRPFQKQATILPVDGVGTLCQLVHRVLRSQEEIALQELAKDRLMLELARDRELVVDLSQDAMAKANSLTAAAVGASVGAGVGVVVAIVLGAASALRKP